MIWLLSMFPAFTKLHADLLIANSRADAHKAQADQWQQIAEQRAESVEAHAAHVEDLKRMVDHFSFQATRRYVFNRNEVPAVPAESPRPVAGKQFARDLVNKRVQQFNEQIRRASQLTTEQEIEQLRQEAAEAIEQAG